MIFNAALALKPAGALGFAMTAASAAAAYEPFPEGYDYPIDAATLGGWVASQW